MVYIASKRKPKSKTKDKGSREAPLLKSLVEQSLARSAGTSGMVSRDPVYHLAESFTTTFNSIGKQKASQMAVEKAPGTEKVNGNPEQTTRPETESSDEFPEYQISREEKERGDFYRKFSDIAFQNGHLASAVLQSDGTAMFVSCLKRALGQSGPHNLKQTRLFSKTSVHAPIKGNDTSAKAVFNRYAEGAVGIVIDSTKSAREALGVFEQLAADNPDQAVPGMEENNLPRLYPFLNSAEDKERLALYENRLKELTKLEQDSAAASESQDIREQKAVLVAAINKTQSIINKKAQKKRQFLAQLAQLLANSQEALKTFTQPGFASSLVEEIWEEQGMPEDGDDNNPEEPTGDTEEQ